MQVMAFCFDTVLDMDFRERISIDSKVLAGKPAVRGTRLSVEFVIDLLAAGWTQEQILENYPNLSVLDLRACLAYAGDLLHSEVNFPLETA